MQISFFYIWLSSILITIIKIEESQIQYYYCIILNICVIELSKSVNK